MIQNCHWRQATRAALKQAAREQDRTVSAVLRQAGIDRSLFEPRHDQRGLSLETLAKLDAAGVSWTRIALEAERLSQVMERQAVAA
jgi:hypothetical protein